MKVKIFSVLFLVATLVGCTTEGQLKEKVAKMLKDDPSLLINAIESKPVEFIEALQKAAQIAQDEQAKKRKEEEDKKLEESFNTPLQPTISEKDMIRGNKDAPITLVEYSDFECPFCARGFATVQELLEKYGDKIRFVYKHLPLSFHPNAMITSQYFEAIGKQDPKKAWEFHDEVLRNQSKLRQGEKFLKAAAEKVGADMKKLATDVESEDVKKKIQADMEEAQKFGFQGTPGFLLNGVPVRGAYPAEHFVQIVEELKKRGKVTL